MNIILIAAMAKNRTIGKNNEIPWKIKGEQKMFKEITVGHVVIMGRKTFESIGRPLKDRRNIIITSQSDYSVSDCEIAHGIKSAIAMCSEYDQVFIIGGGNIYEQSLPIANKIYLTVLHREICGDAFFPKISLDDFKITSSKLLEFSEPATLYRYERI